MLYVLRILSVVIILILFAGCAGKPSEPVLIEGHPEWMRIIPDEEGYYFGIGMDDDLNEAKQKSIIDAGTQFSTQVRTVFLENVRESDGNIETVVKKMDEQLTDQIIYGVKFVDQYQDPKGNHWVLSRAPLSCMLDVTEGFLLSYKLEMKEMDVAMEKIVEIIDRKIETEAFHRTLWTFKDSSGNITVDKGGEDAPTGSGTIVLWDFNDSKDGWTISTGQGSGISRFEERNALRISVLSDSSLIDLKSGSFEEMDFSEMSIEVRFWGPASWTQNMEIQFTAYNPDGRWRGSEPPQVTSRVKPGEWNVQRYPFRFETRGEGTIENISRIGLELLGWNASGSDSIYIDYIRVYER